MSEPRDRDPSRVGDVVAAKYRLDEELGRGGMGAVYRAYHLRVHKEFAIKILLSEVVEHRSIASRFFLEAQAAGRIGHPGILDVYDVGEAADGTPYIVMELLRGEPLSSLVRRERMDIDVACWIAMEVLDVLDAAHKNEIIHRDVKPQNVFLTERAGTTSPTSTDAPGSKSASTSSAGGDDAPPPTPMPGSGLTRGVKLLDFGVAKFSGSSEASALTRSGEIIGSPLYMAPEQAKGEADLDARADVWSVGAMLFEMLTGKCAHAATTPVAVLAKILTEQAPAPSTRDDRIPPELDAVVEKALRIDRKDRWGSAREMRDALDDVRKKRGTAGTVPILPPAPKRAATQPTSVNDRTPGAITSTVAAPSEPPRRPWSSPPRDPPSAKQTGARKSGTNGDNSQLAATPTSTITGASAFASRSRVLIGAIAGIGAIALVGWYITAHSNDGAPDPTTTKQTAPPPTTTPSPPSASPSVEPSTTTTAPTTSIAFPSATVSATRPTPATTTATATATQAIPAAAPKCAQGEVLSKGHCCARGLEWQGTRCERPLATTF